MKRRTKILKGLFCGLYLLTVLQAQAELFSLTGSSNPEVVRIDEDSLESNGGSTQATSGGKNDVTFDETGRLFAISNESVMEIDPESLEIIHQQPFNGLTFGLAARAGRLFIMTGASSPALVRFDAETLQVDAGSVQGTNGGSNKLAFDETGRLFGISNIGLLEFDPDTLAIINQSSFEGPVRGLAARGGSIFTLTGSDGLSLVRFDADTLALRQGTASGTLGLRFDLAFDENGRLFAIANQMFLEFDPISLKVIDSRPYNGSLGGIAADEFAFATTVGSISSVEATDTEVQLTIPRAPGRRIGVEFSSDLTQGAWIDLGNFFDTGDPVATFTDLDPIRRSGARGYYRAFLRPLLQF